MKKKLIKMLEELAIENEIQKQEISKLNNMLGKKEPKEEVWWLCNKWCGNSFTKGKEYKQVFFSNDLLTLIDNHFHHNVVSTRNFTKVEKNKELEEAKEVVKDWRFGKCSYSSNEIDKAIETILNHLENENKN